MPQGCPLFSLWLKPCSPLLSVFFFKQNLSCSLWTVVQQIYCETFNEKHCNECNIAWVNSHYSVGTGCFLKFSYTSPKDFFLLRKGKRVSLKVSNPSNSRITISYSNEFIGCSSTYSITAFSRRFDELAFSKTVLHSDLRWMINCDISCWNAGLTNKVRPQCFFVF